MKSKESGTVRYAYGVATALLLGGTAFSLATGSAGAQVAQNAPSAMAPRPGAPMSFADLAARLQPAVVNISTRQRVPVRTQADPLEEFFRRFGFPVAAKAPAGRASRVARAPAKRARSAPASSSRPTVTSSPTIT
jgi:serine protease Do